MKRFETGQLVEDLAGNVLKVIENDEMWTKLKWVRENGELSKGILWLLPSQLATYTELNVEGE